MVSEFEKAMREAEEFENKITNHILSSMAKKMDEEIMNIIKEGKTK